MGWAQLTNKQTTKVTIKRTVAGYINVTVLVDPRATGVLILNLLTSSSNLPVLHGVSHWSLIS